MFHSLTVHHPGERAALISPQLPHVGSDRCLGFDYVARGRHVGGLGVKTKDDVPIWSLKDNGVKSESMMIFFNIFYSSELIFFVLYLIVKYDYISIYI